MLVLQLNNVSVTKDDEITVSVNDYLNPFSPQDGVEYTRKTSDDLWGGEHAVTVMPKDLQTEVLLGSELKNGANSRLICMSFPSSGNAERESEMPEYVVTVMSSPQTVTVPVWVVIPAGLVIALIVVFVRKSAQLFEGCALWIMFHFEELAWRVLQVPDRVSYGGNVHRKFPPIFLIYGRQKGFAFCGKRLGALPQDPTTFLEKGRSKTFNHSCRKL